MGVFDTPIYPTQQMISAGVTPPTMTVWDDGTYINARMYYGIVSSVGYDLQIQFYRNQPAAISQNQNLSLYRTVLVPSSNLMGDVTTGVIAFAASMTDDVGPCNFSGRGNSLGGHTFEGCLLTKAGHGITAVDVGKRWVDNVGRNWRLLSVPTVDTLFFAAQADVNGYTEARVSTTGTLTSLDGASNVSTPFTSADGRQSGAYMTIPNGGWSRDRVLSILCDGVELAPLGFQFGVKKLVMRDKYNVPSHSNVYTEMTTSSPDLRTVTAGLNVTREFYVYGWGQLSCLESLRVITGNWDINGDTLMQSNPLTAASSWVNRWRWIPGAAASGPGGHNLSVPALQNTGPAGDPVWLMPTHAADANYCPDGHVEFTTTSAASLTSATALIGQWVSMDPLLFEGSIANRKTNLTFASSGFGFWRIATSSNKAYLNIFVTQSGFQDINSSVRSVSHRRWFQPPASGPIAVSYVQEIDGRITLRVAWQAAHGIVSVALPQWLNGRVASVVYQTGGTLLSGRVSNGAISLDCSSATGHMIVTLAARNL